ncbi:hypothetical protein GYH30_018579 [Glycine max]|nr:hypothetical protein GYH30_018579 [Glycine max]
MASSLFAVEELTIGATTDFVNNGGFKIDEDNVQDMLVGSDFTEEGVEGIMGGRVDSR